jgi:23S rRNA pseudouridine1911/1915/1917 synthase
MTRNQGYRYRHVLGQAANGHTVLSYLVKHFPHSSQSQWQERISAGEIEIDHVIAKGEEVLRVGIPLVWNRPGWIEPATPQTFSVVYHDQHILLVDKPSGLPTLPGGGFFENTLLSLVNHEYPDARPLHRLGRATSGLLIFALDAETASLINKSWSAIRKQYQALSQGLAKLDHYDIQCPIGLRDHPRLGKLHAASETGKPARSVARALERRDDCTLFEVDLHNGRPHQIRIHLAFIGHPLAGDPLYSKGGLPLTDQPGLPGDAGYHLHAKRLVLTHPHTGQVLDLMADLPPILQFETDALLRNQQQS